MKELLSLAHTSAVLHAGDSCLVAEVLLCSVSVCECFAVLEDGALAHNLQEQESEYSVHLTLLSYSYTS